MKKKDTSCILIGSRSASHAYTATAKKKKNEAVSHIGTKTGRDTILPGHRLQLTVEQVTEGRRPVVLCGNLSDLNQVSPLSSSQP